MWHWARTYVLTATLIVASVAAAQTAAQADEQLELGNRATAMRTYRLLADRGDAQAQLSVGLFSDDQAERMRWLRLLAEKGNPEAQYNLAVELSSSDASSPEAMTWYAKAFTTYLEQGKRGDARAQEEVAFLYDHGPGSMLNPAQATTWMRQAVDSYRQLAQKDDLAAMEWLTSRDYAGKDDREVQVWRERIVAAHRLAAERGSIPDQLWLGDDLRLNDPEAAVTWYTKAAGAGSVVALLRLGELHQELSSSADNDEQAQELAGEARTWYAAAAGRGSAAAQVALADMLHQGEGGIPDLVEAARLYRLATAEDNGTAAFRLAGLYALGEGVPVDPSEALRLYQVAARRGIAEGAVQVGLMYAAGEGVTKNVDEAKTWLERAGRFPTPALAVRLGRIYLADDVIAHDYAEALRYFNIAAGQPEAQYHLGLMYAEGYGVPVNPSKAVQLWRTSAEQGFPDAACQLGQVYAAGNGVGKDYVSAARWLLNATALEADVMTAMLYGTRTCYAEAKFRLGLLYSEGLGVERNMTEALRWWRAAANQGHEQAAEMLKKY